ncbi:MAG: cob(I)yrinic acid a,c-diamide adenosyltransferase [Bacteroidales bacterium]|nr:cob(I)yrinic acid a,c-diamide adenosyltransferase [Bacteroidales bacterium]
MENKDWKIYTKTGDKGETSLIGGTRVPKYDDRIEAYGTLDELNSFLGVVYDSVDKEDVKNVLQTIIEHVFIIESLVAYDKSSGEEITLPQIYDQDVLFLENEIDKMNEVLPELNHFILPGGHLASSYCHVARCVCRRAERKILLLGTKTDIDKIILTYMNRLSDYLFVLSRFLCSQNTCNEKEWITKNK